MPQADDKNIEWLGCPIFADRKTDPKTKEEKVEPAMKRNIQLGLKQDGSVVWREWPQ